MKLQVLSGNFVFFHPAHGTLVVDLLVCLIGEQSNHNGMLFGLNICRLPTHKL